MYPLLIPDESCYCLGNIFIFPLSCSTENAKKKVNVKMKEGSEIISQVIEFGCEF